MNILSFQVTASTIHTTLPMICGRCSTDNVVGSLSCAQCNNSLQGVRSNPTVLCDSTCVERGCTNDRVYITGLSDKVTEDDLVDLFRGIGVIAKIKQKRGFKDQWPWSVKLYKDERGFPKGDATVSYEDPMAAHSAGEFFNGYELRGSKITVEMATRRAYYCAHESRQPQQSSRGIKGGHHRQAGVALGSGHQYDRARATEVSPRASGYQAASQNTYSGREYCAEYTAPPSRHMAENTLQKNNLQQREGREPLSRSGHSYRERHRPY
mmetsp:Transcript_23468/g.79899  ORF Transcript_23468/g.79899 Transcript_23468/m.79899 type:complete len:267 (-) Transcript_23468:1034-1834(-)